MTRISQALFLLFERRRGSAWPRPHSLAARWRRLGPEVQLSTGDNPQRPVLAVSPAATP